MTAKTRRWLFVALSMLSLVVPAILIVAIYFARTREVSYGSLPSHDIHVRTFALVFGPAATAVLFYAAVLISPRIPERGIRRHVLAAFCALVLSALVLFAVFLTLDHKNYFPAGS